MDPERLPLMAAKDSKQATMIPAPSSPLTDHARRWTLADLLADPYVLYRVPTVQLQQLYHCTAAALAVTPIHADADQYRERLQEIRTGIGRTLATRRQLDAEEATRTAQDAREPETAPDTPDSPLASLSPEQQAVQLLRAALLLIQQPPDSGSNGHGGQRQPVTPRPPRPTPPAGRQPLTDSPF